MEKKKEMTRNLQLILFLTLVILAACSNDQLTASSDSEKKFQALIPVTDMNKSLKLEVYGDEKNFQSDSQIHLRLYNKSSYNIVFEVDSYMKLLTLMDNEWIEVKNGNTYSGKLILAPQGTPLLDSNTTWVQPIVDSNILKNSKKDMLLRIVIIGELTENDIQTGKLVGAYIDVDINS